MIDNNEFNDLGGVWDDGSNPWDTEDLSDLHRLLDDEGDRPFPDEQAVESRSPRREMQEQPTRSHREAKPAKPSKEPPKKAKADKAKPKKEKPSKKKRAPEEPEDPFAGLPSMRGSKEKRADPDDGQGKKGRKEKKEECSMDCGPEWSLWELFMEALPEISRQYPWGRWMLQRRP